MVHVNEQKITYNHEKSGQKWLKFNNKTLTNRFIEVPESRMAKLQGRMWAAKRHGSPAWVVVGKESGCERRNHMF